MQVLYKSRWAQLGFSRVISDHVINFDGYRLCFLIVIDSFTGFGLAMSCANSSVMTS